MNKLIFLISILVLLSSCRKSEKSYKVTEKSGIKTIHNLKPANDRLGIEVKELFRISGDSDNIDSQFKNIVNIDLDSQGNIYALDLKSCSVKKFSSDGVFITSMGKKGDGPGESIYPQGLICLDDTLNVLSVRKKVMLRFDTDGNFIENQSTKECHMPVYLTEAGDNFVAYLANWRRSPEGVFMDYDFAIINHQFDILKRVYKQTYAQKDVRYADTGHPFTTTKDGILFSEFSEDAYSIDFLNFDGEKSYSFNKSYRKIIMSDDELNTLYNGKIPENHKKYKNAIAKLYSDKQDRVWASVSAERDNSNSSDFIVDIFKDGVYENRVVLDIFGNSDESMDYLYQVEKDKIYCINNKDSEIIVYQYNYTGI